MGRGTPRSDLSSDMRCKVVVAALVVLGVTLTLGK
jgi:hypothetical protein